LNRPNHLNVTAAVCLRLSIVKVSGLILSPELSKMAKRWARYLASTNSLQHSNTKYKGVDLGENIAMKESRNEKATYTGEYKT